MNGVARSGVWRWRISRRRAWGNIVLARNCMTQARGRLPRQPGEADSSCWWTSGSGAGQRIVCSELGGKN
eukprot:23794-Pyramimonas_sp.AAC.1